MQDLHSPPGHEPIRQGNGSTSNREKRRIPTDPGRERKASFKRKPTTRSRIRKRSRTTWTVKVIPPYVWRFFVCERLFFLAWLFVRPLSGLATARARFGGAERVPSVSTFPIAPTLFAIVPIVDPTVLATTVRIFSTGFFGIALPVTSSCLDYCL